VETAIKKEFPDIKIFRLDKDSAKTEKKAQEIMKRFYATPGSILLGTEMALFYLTENVENAAVASIDSLFSLPDFRINEKILYSLLAVRSRAGRVFLVQTRNADNPLFEYALKGNLIDFYKQEIADRESFQYPPFSVFIKISLEGTPVAAAKAIEELSSRLAAFGPKSYQAFSPSKRGNAVHHILISKHSSEWPDDELLAILRALPMSVSVRIDPESLL
jgi:primosomal protein N'